MKMKWNNEGFKAGGTPQVEYQWKVDDHWNKLRVRARSRIKNTGKDTKVGFVLDTRRSMFRTTERRWNTKLNVQMERLGRRSSQLHLRCPTFVWKGIRSCSR